MNTSHAIEFLSPFSVLDLTNESGYYLCAKVLSDLGARVMRLEKPGVARDFWWWAYNGNKNVVCLDIASEPAKLREFARHADILIECFPPGYLDLIGLGYADLKKLNPKLIMASITPFGQTGPYRDWKASDLELMALSGVLIGIGDPDRPPVRIGLPQSHLFASLEAAVGILIALNLRGLTGQGQQVDVSAQESVHGILESRVRKQRMPGASIKRRGGYHGPMPSIILGGGKATYQHARHPQIWKCRDGHVNFLVHPALLGADSNRALVKHMEGEGDLLPDVVKNSPWETFDWDQTSPEDAARIWEAFGRFFARHTRRELYQIALQERVQLFPGNTVADLLDEPQLEARGFWRSQQIPELGRTLKFPGPFAQMRFSPTSGTTGPKPKAKEDQPLLPFQGVKVLDFTWVVTGPWITQWLAVYGAEVIKVESSVHPDTGRRGTGLGFVSLNSGKKSLTLDLKRATGQQYARSLIEWADVVAENFSPGTIQKLGFGYDEISRTNPRIVMLSASMFGNTGPYAFQPGLGQILTSLSGFNEITGWPDRLPVTAHGPYTDVIACRMGAATLFAALDYQRRTGRGCYIDLSQFEASLHLLAPLILEYQATGKLLSRAGNHSPTESPHGVFPCQVADRWCAISISSDSEWRAFCETWARPELAQDPRFATLAARQQNEDELEKLIAEWTAGLAAEEAMARLQQNGVKAAVVADWDDILRDPQLNHRKHFVTVKHPQLGEYDYLDAGFRLEKAAPRVGPAPLFGEHNRYISTQLLGMSDAEFETYSNAGAFQ